MKKGLPLICLLLFGFTINGLSQNKVTGRVTDASIRGEGLPGVTVLEKGTSNGAATDYDGNYSLSVSEGAILVFSFIGYQSQEYKVGSQSIINISLEPEITGLDEVVITAFGIEKEKKSLGYAQTEVLGKELTEAKDISVASMLYGKVSGAVVLRPATGPAGSTKISIRGSSSFGADADPLIVIDGVPVSNTKLGETGQFGGVDGGDVFSSINPDDIESINVLKGASAGVLYGERGANGVLIITTKSGTQGLSVEYNGNFTMDMPAYFADFFQNEYGQGRRGDRPTSKEDALRQTGSWGDKFDGTPFVYYDGVERPYSAAPDNDVTNFYRNGYTINNNLSISGGNENVSSRLSVSSLQNRGIVPTATYERYTANFNTSMKFSKKLTMGAKANYVEEKAENRTNNGDFPSNPGKSFISLPTNISSSILKSTVRDETRLDRTLGAIKWNDNVFVSNPYWGVRENQQGDDKRRITGFLLAKYQFIPQLSLQARYALDYTQVDDFNIIEQGTEWEPLGSFTQGTREINDNTLDFILNYNQKFFNWFTLNTNFGGTQNVRSSYTYIVSGKNYILPEVYSITNLSEKDIPTTGVSERQTNGFYATLSLDFAGFVYLDGSFRRDWYSTLSTQLGDQFSDNQADYGSVSASIIASEAFTLPDFVTFSKLRVAYGAAGSANIEPYKVLPSYIIEPQLYDNTRFSSSILQVPTGQIRGTSYSNSFLVPTVTRSLEIGTDTRLFRDRLRIDLTYYKENTIRQLLDVDLSKFTGYQSTTINSGDVQNQGIELQIGGRPIDSKNLQWDISLNYTRNRNKVLRIADGIDNVAGETGRFDVAVRSTVGAPTQEIYGTAFLRNENGDILYENGLPLIAPDRKRLGNFNPDFFGGITNTWTYKNFSLSVLIDYKIGGELHSLSNAGALGSGKHEATLVGRDNPFFQIIGEGVDQASGEPNSEWVFLDQYYGRLAGIAEHSMFDASFVKIRQAVLGYDLPNNIVSKTPFSKVHFGIVGRNLFFLMNGLSDLGIDPEAVYNTGGAGFEYASLPTTRSLGFNLNLKF
ncbi:MAG: SusC/RagA family TonB-linked outer membrane protein [Cyclobacteriaceae bacterium]